MKLLPALAIVLFASSARAEQTTSALNWVRLPGTEGCLSASDLSARVEKRLGRAVFVPPGAADVAIEGRVEVKKRGFKMVVRGVRRDGTEIGARELDSERPDCHALDDTVALVVALMIDPDADAPKPAPTPPPEPPPPAREVVHERVIVREVERPPPPPAQPSSLLVDGYGAGTLAFGRLPGADPGLALALRVGPRRFPVEVALGTIPSGTFSSGDVRASYWLIEAGLGICPAVPLGTRVELGGCAGARIGNVRMRGDGFATNTEVDRPLVDAALGPRVLVTIAPPVFALAGVTAVVPFVRQRTTYTAPDGTTQVLYERAALGAEALVGVGVRFSP